MSSTIHFILTGGTIDSYYEPSKDTAVPHQQSIIPKYIESLKLYLQSEFTTICMKDSRDISDADRQQMLAAIEKSPHTHHIVTHGTYTMPLTARYLKEKLQRQDTTVVLTASAIPIDGFPNSDGPFNLGYAIAKLDQLAPGVYVAINGRIFDPEEVVKIVKDARFASLSE